MVRRHTNRRQRENGGEDPLAYLLCQFAAADSDPLACNWTADPLQRHEVLNQAGIRLRSTLTSERRWTLLYFGIDQQSLGWIRIIAYTEDISRILDSRGICFQALKDHQDDKKAPSVCRSCREGVFGGQYLWMQRH